jgi:hypothetical protein
LAVTGFVARNGIAGNWIWWSLAASGILTVFFYARLWGRAGVLTDAEFAEIDIAAGRLDFCAVSGLSIWGCPST